MSNGARGASATRRKYRRDGEDAEIALRVRWLRVQRGMSQSTLAKTLGVSFQQVQKYEKGVNRISAGRLLKMARALEAPIAYFYAGLEKRMDDSTLSDNLTLLQSKASVRMIRAYAKMPPRTQTKLALFIESLS